MNMSCPNFYSFSCRMTGFSEYFEAYRSNASIFDMELFTDVHDRTKRAALHEYACLSDF
ncbi:MULTISPECIES: hypothetical protein [Bartonella]|uniref:hypothetical protein n=1 Tax=Bartonella TaxID=773 RepID=UPI0018DCE833|nr:MULTISPECIES: hypothetical protein [Bartonella]MBH9974343.1 hypothetical protein [Bartonella choladocola]MBI0013950.1 hypothetical protein [Bartonella sp. B10834G3]